MQRFSSQVTIHFQLGIGPSSSLLDSQFSFIQISTVSSSSSKKNKNYCRRMCTHNSDWMPSRPAHSKRKHRSKPKVQIYRLTRRIRCDEEKEGKDMQLKNIKLYLENQSIIEENEKLRKKANLLHQENLALMSELQKEFPHLDRFSTTLFLLLHKH